MNFGAGKYTYTVQEGWGRLPEGWKFGWIPAVAVDSRDRIYVYSRSEHPMVIFDRDGNFLTSWGEDVLKDAHGIFIDRDDIVYVAELDQRVSILTLEGKRLTEWGRGVKSETPGEFRACPHGIWTDSHGDLYVGEVQTDGRIQKFIRQR